MQKQIRERLPRLWNDRPNAGGSVNLYWDNESGINSQNLGILICDKTRMMDIAKPHITDYPPDNNGFSPLPTVNIDGLAESIIKECDGNHSDYPTY